MVADTPELGALRKVSGRALLDMTDGVGFDAVGAAWVLDADSQTWHYLLISPMIDSKGPRWVHERLLQVFRKLRLPEGITPLDIVVASPRQLDMQKLSQLGLIATGSMIQFSDINVNGMHVHNIAVYRMRPMKAHAGEQASDFDARVRELMAA